MSSAQEKVLIAVLTAVCLDLYVRIQTHVLPSILLWLTSLASH